MSIIDPIVTLRNNLGLSLGSDADHPVFRIRGLLNRINGASGQAPILDYALRLNHSYGDSLAIIIVGCGGTGSQLVPNLIHLCTTRKLAGLPMPKIVLVDGDIVEEKNLLRQRFTPHDLGMNKADALARRYSAAFGIEITSYPIYLKSRADIANIAADSTGTYHILVGAVDNNRARAIMWSYLEESSHTYWIDGGNDKYHGQAILSYSSGTDYMYVRGRSWTEAGMLEECFFKPRLPNYFDYFPEELLKSFAEPEVPTEGSCEAMVAEDPQTALANYASAYALHILVSQVLSNNIYTSMIEFDGQSGLHKPRLISQLNLADDHQLLKTSGSRLAEILSLPECPYGDLKGSSYFVHKLYDKPA